MPTCSKTFSIEVTEVSCIIDNSSPLPNGTEDEISTIQLTASGATGPYTFAIISGALPTGVTMNAAGLITINTSTPSTGTFTVQATDSTLPTPFQCSKEFSLTIVAANPPAWPQLLWGQSTGGGNGSFGPNNAAFASFTGSASSSPPTLYPNPGNRSNTAELNSVVPWTGMSRLAINGSRVNGNGTITVDVQRNGVTVVSYSLTGESEVVNIDFSVAGGTQITVQVSVQAFGGSQGGPAVSGTFSNL